MTRAWRVADADWNSWPDGVSDADRLALVRREGLAGLELGVYDAAVELAPERVEALGPSVAAVLLSLPPARWPGGALTGEVDRLLDQVQACASVCRRLGLGVLGLWPGADTGVADDGVDAALRRVVEVAATHGVSVAVEYKPGTVLPDAASTQAVCDRVPGLGVLLDTGHAHAAGEDPAEVVALLGGLLRHVHLGDAHPGAGDDDLPCGAVHDFGPLVSALDRHGFAGVAAFDLYGAVVSGRWTGEQAVVASLQHLRGVGL